MSSPTACVPPVVEVIELARPIIEIVAEPSASVLEMLSSPGVVEVVDAPQVSVLEALTSDLSVVELVTAGPQGPPGPIGPSGDGAGAYIHDQVVPGTVWTIQHELGFDPAGITVIDADGYQLDGFGVQYLTTGVSLRLSFDISVAGAAYVS